MAADWLLIDGSSVMFRAFFGIPVTAFKAPDGQPVNAVRGFLDMLARLVIDRKPRAILVATDEDWRPKFRVDVIPSYKTARLERGAMPPELQPQEPIIREVLAAIGVEVVGSDGFEAEDVIASLLPKIQGKVEIVTLGGVTFGRMTAQRGWRWSEQHHRRASCVCLRRGVSALRHTLRTQLADCVPLMRALGQQ